MKPRFPGSREDHPAYIGLGSNVGNRKKHLETALRLIGEIPGCSVLSVSSFYITSPVGPRQRSFMNAVAKLRTRLSPGYLLDALGGIERQLGRPPRHAHWGPRLIDLDIIMYGRVVLDTPRLTVPHRELPFRRFVLEPLSEIAPGLRHPLLKLTIRTLRDRCRLTHPGQRITMRKEVSI